MKLLNIRFERNPHNQTRHVHMIWRAREGDGDAELLHHLVEAIKEHGAITATDFAHLVDTYPEDAHDALNMDETPKPTSAPVEEETDPLVGSW